MPTDKAYKVRTKHNNLHLRVLKGHFATNHSHLNYFIDVTMQKSRLSEAKAVAHDLAAAFRTNTIIDTILCLDGMEVVGTCIANELTKGDFVNLNSHKTIYLVTPEYTQGSQIIFRDSITPMITGKNVLIVAASVATGYTARGAIEAVRYYGGSVAGICSIFATMESYMGYRVESVFNPNDLDGYQSLPSHECPMCKRGERIDALVNKFGFSKL